MNPAALLVVQARLSSTRLPRKVLADVAGEPMLVLLLRRLERVAHAASLLLATSDDSSDDPLVEHAERLGVEVRRGPLDDVLARYASAIGDHVGPVVRITGDCPLVDPAVIDASLALFYDRPGIRYVQNVLPRSYPDGLDIEVVDADVLRELAAEALDAYDREHVTTAVRRDHARFPAAVLPAPDDGTIARLRWTVDTAEDLDFVRAVVERLGKRRYDAGWREVLEAAEQSPRLERGLTPFPT